MAGWARARRGKAHSPGLALSPTFLSTAGCLRGQSWRGPCPQTPAGPVLDGQVGGTHVAIDQTHSPLYHRKVSSLAWEGGSPFLAPTFCFALALGFTGSGRITVVSV